MKLKHKIQWEENGRISRQRINLNYLVAYVAYDGTVALK